MVSIVTLSVCGEASARRMTGSMVLAAPVRDAHAHEIVARLAGAGDPDDLAGRSIERGPFGEAADCRHTASLVIMQLHARRKRCSGAPEREVGHGRNRN